jgi:hypothetical protein
MLRWLPFMLLPVSFSTTYAIDSGTAQGTLHIGRETITLTHAYAQLHNNTEGPLDRSKKMRILIVDREVTRSTSLRRTPQPACGAGAAAACASAASA